MLNQHVPQIKGHTQTSLYQRVMITKLNYTLAIIYIHFLESMNEEN